MRTRSQTELLFARNLKLLRASRGLSKVQLAALAGLHEVEILWFESSVRTPLLERLLKLSEVFEVDLQDFVTPLTAIPRREVKKVSFDQAAENLRSNMKKLRLKAGLTQAQLGERAGVDKTTIGHNERGHHLPNLDNMVKLSVALGVTLDELVKGKL